MLLKKLENGGGGHLVARFLVFFLVVLFLLIFITPVRGYNLNLSYHYKMANEDPYLGDVDSDGRITVSDAILVLRDIVGLQPLPSVDSRQRADVNLDGQIDVGDAITILRHIVGLVDRFVPADPAVVSTEKALIYGLGAPNVSTIILHEDVVLENPLEISKNVILKGKLSGDEKYAIAGEVIVGSDVGNFCAQNMTIDTLTLYGNGELVAELLGVEINRLNVNDEVTIKLRKADTGYEDSQVIEAFFFSNAVVYGGDCIHWALINANVIVQWMDGRPDEEFVTSIDPNRSNVEYLFPLEVTAGSTNIPIKITLKDNSDNPLGGWFNVVVYEEGTGNWYDKRKLFDSNGEGTIWVDKKEAGYYEEIALIVEEVLMGRFSVRVNPDSAERLYIEQEPSGSDDSTGKTGVITVVTRDKYGNNSSEGLGDNVLIEAVLSEGVFTEDSGNVKNIGKDGDNGRVVFDDLTVKTNVSNLVTVDLTVSFNCEGFPSVTSGRFDVFGISGVDPGKSEVEVADQYPEAGKDNVKLIIKLRDTGGNPVSGTFYTVVSEDRFSGPVVYNDNGEYEMKLTETKAGHYAGLEVSVDLANIGSFNLTVSPAAAEKMYFPEEYESHFIHKLGEHLEISMTVTDKYGNAVQGQDVYVFSTLQWASTEFLRYTFAGGTTRQVSDASGIVNFDDLIIDGVGVYRIYFDFDDNFDVLGIENPLLQIGVWMLANDSYVTWKTYPEVLEVETAERFLIVITPEDEEGNRMEGLPTGDFDVTVRCRHTGEVIDLITHNFYEWYYGIYLTNVSYTESAEIEITVSFRGNVLEKKMLVNITQV